MVNWLSPFWPQSIQNKVLAFSSFRQGGYSQTPYHALNLAAHVADNLKSVHDNRQLLQQFVGFHHPVWLEQTHSSQSVILTHEHAIGNLPLHADASISFTPGITCVVLTADCLPILITNNDASFVAAIHAGWRGLTKGIIQQTLAKIPVSMQQDLFVWLGPCIQQSAFEVDTVVYEAFCDIDSRYAEAFIALSKSEKWQCSLPKLAMMILDSYSCHISTSSFCTVSHSEKFFSYRRELITGRMATGIMLK